MSEAVQKKFQKLVRELGRLIRAEAEGSLSGKKSGTKVKSRADTPSWGSAFLDIRWYAVAAGHIAKLRIVLPSGDLHSLQTTDDMDKLLIKIGTVRKDDWPAKWYGLKVTVSFEGVVTTEFDNDPNCVVDPTFFKS